MPPEKPSAPSGKRFALYILLFIFLLSPYELFSFPFPAPLIAKTLEMVTGNQYLDCGGYICFEEPTRDAWFLIICFYLIFFAIFLLLKYLEKRQTITKTVRTFIFSLLLFFSFGSLLSITEGENCSILKDSDTTGRVKSLCYHDRALKTNDVVNCSKIEYPETRDGCYYSMARAVNDPSLCLSIGRDREREDCWSFLNSNEWLRSYPR